MSNVIMSNKVASHPVIAIEASKESPISLTHSNAVTARTQHMQLILESDDIR
jgi:hypothetical protein